jgi:pyrroloquinoline quinone (PQQ) biosynthesis protein C
MLSETTIIDQICELCIQSSKNMSWLVEPLTPGRARAFILQHVLRNRLFSAVIRPAWVSRCPDLDVVRKTIAQMREELVRDDAIQRPHTEILWAMGRNIGLTNEEMDASRPVPLVEAAFNIWENMARTRHWICGWMASSVGEFLLTELPSHSARAAVWKQSLSLTDEQVFFFSYHEKADEGHAGRNVWGPIARHVHTDSDRQEVLSGARLALTALELFYRGVARLGDELDISSPRVSAPRR